MKDLQQNTLLEQELDFRAARALCRDGWACEQINAVLKHVAISQEQFAMMEAQSKELDELQKVFGAPADAISTGHTDLNSSDLDFLNRGPDAAVAVLREKGWSKHEISIVIQDSMFPNVEEPKRVHPRPASPATRPGQQPAAVSPAFATQGRNGYALGHPDAGIATLPHPANKPASRGRSTLARDTLILAFMAGIALALVFTLL